MDFKNIKPEDIISPSSSPGKQEYTRSAILIILAVFLIFSAFSSFYTIEPNEVGVVRRFGRFVRTTSPGLHFKLPWRIEKVNKVKVDYIFKEEFGFRTLKAGIKSQYASRNYDDESLMLTGDLNVLQVEWIVQYKIKDAAQFLFHIRDQRKTLRDISESVMRKIVGDYSLNEVLSSKRMEINDIAQQNMQEILDSYNSGIAIVTVKLQDVNPPEPVQPAFNEVNEAKQERERMINQAWQIYNQKIPAARGQALKIVKEAEGYAQEKINRALGDAERFLLLLEAYKEAKEVTRRRLYLEKMREIVGKAHKVFIIDEEEKGILPLLRLENGE